MNIIIPQPMRVQLYAGEKHENHHRKQGCSVQAFDDVRRKDRGVKIGRKFAENRGAQRDTTQNLHHDQWQSPPTAQNPPNSERQGQQNQKHKDHRLAAGHGMCLAGLMP
jgi:hypothetical protein